ncbi:hypothetical protein MIR68_006551, partial [Amoeboaphelidium protococcarum]
MNVSEKSLRCERSQARMSMDASNYQTYFLVQFLILRQSPPTFGRPRYYIFSEYPYYHITSRKLNEHEVNYPANEREMLAIVWACQHFRHYLEGVKFTVHTDHQALRYVFTQPDLSRRMARWMETLANFDFTIMYKSGETNHIADWLSRPLLSNAVQAVEGQLSGGNFQMDKNEDWEKCHFGSLHVPFELEQHLDDMSNWPTLLIDKKYEKLKLSEDAKDWLKRQANDFEFNTDQNILFRVTKGGKKVAFLPIKSRADIAQAYHVGNGHQHWKMVEYKMKQKYWWPSMKNDIRVWCEQCQECQLYSNDDLSKKVPMQKMDVDMKPLSRWGLDFIGPLPMTVNGNQWIITAVDHVTRWPVAKALPEATAENIAQFIYSEIMINYGLPTEILTDRGRNFLANSLKRYLQMMKVKHLKTSAYHPRTNGKVENLNGSIGKILAKCVKGAVHKWDEFLDEALFHLRCKVHTVTQFSPFKLLYGFEPAVPGDTLKPFILSERDADDVVEIRARLLEDLDQDRAAAVERSRVAADKAKLQYDKQVKEDPLNVGEWVLLRRGNRKKFESKWIGPYKVIKEVFKGVYQLSDPSGTNKEDYVHRDRLKRAKVDEKNPPQTFWQEEKLDEEDEDVFWLKSQGSIDADAVNLKVTLDTLDDFSCLKVSK